MKKISGFIITALTTLLLSGCGEDGGVAFDPGSAGGSSSSCAGVTVGGFCWYYSNTNESCTTVCASHGGFNAGTVSYAGSSGSLANCSAVLGALGAPNGLAAPIDNACVTAPLVGCSYDANTQVRVRCTTATTSAAASAFWARRACACNQ